MPTPSIKELHERRREKIRRRQELFLQAYAKGHGIVRACKIVGIHRETVRKWRENDEDFRRRMDEAEVSLIEIAEEKLFEKVKAGDLKAIQFFLINRAPDRWKLSGQAGATAVDQKVLVVVHTEKATKRGRKRADTVEVEVGRAEV